MGLFWMVEKPAEYQLANIKLGQEKKFEVIITESMLKKFAELSGDYNPLHMDNDYAKTTIFKKRICHGMLIASFFSRLVGMYLPGKNSLYFSQSLKFISPCFIGDKIFVEGKVLDKSNATRIITLKTVITNEDGKHIVDGQAKVQMKE